jgi:hypothetical protein
MDTQALADLSDDELLHSLRDLLGGSCRGEAALLALLTEVDSRKLYARLAMPSMSAYCTRVLHLSAAEAHLRIVAARVSRKHPILLGYLAEGRLSLSAIATLAPYLTPGNEHALVPCALDLSKNEVRKLVAGIPSKAGRPSASSDWLEELEFRATLRYIEEEEAEAERFAELELGNALLAAEDLGGPVEVAGAVKRERRAPRRARPRSGPAAAPETEALPEPIVPESRSDPVSSAYAPPLVRRDGGDREAGRCRFLDPQGRRCAEKTGLFPADLGRYCPAHLRHAAVRDRVKPATFGYWKSKPRSS